MPDPNATAPMPRRAFLRQSLAGAVGACVGGASLLAAKRSDTAVMVWQIDPFKCVQCGQCMTHCVLSPSAVKCVHSFSMCGYCKLCFGYFRPGAAALNTGAENQMCPTGALRRRYVEAPYYEYTIDADLCVGCGKCVKGCSTFGNGSLQLQINHDLCVNCNECSIARDCPSDAIRRVPLEQPYSMKDRQPPAPS
jgi:Na+-translocating ferredoxin:NAD+ oxidoreductase subunit B